MWRYGDGELKGFLKRIIFDFTGWERDATWMQKSTRLYGSIKLHLKMRRTWLRLIRMRLTSPCRSRIDRYRNERLMIFDRCVFSLFCSHIVCENVKLKPHLHKTRCLTTFYIAAILLIYSTLCTMLLQQVFRVVFTVEDFGNLPTYITKWIKAKKTNARIKEIHW